MFFWHTCQAMVGANMDPALSMMITGILAPHATDMELHTRATEILRGERDRLNQARAAELNEMVRLLVVNGAEIRSWDGILGMGREQPNKKQKNYSKLGL